MDESIVDGPGLRYAVFTQGCPHHCKGCHNPDTHSIDGGYLVHCSKIIKDFLDNPLLAGISFSGGEPFFQPAPLCNIGREVKKAGKNIVVYTGYTLEELLKIDQNKNDILELISMTDILVDGPYLEELRDLELNMRGSSNQRILKKEDIENILQNCA